LLIAFPLSFVQIVFQSGRIQGVRSALLEPSRFFATKTKRKSIDAAEKRFTQQLSVLPSAVLGYGNDGA
jgi:hypothetical protein